MGDTLFKLESLIKPKGAPLFCNFCVEEKGKSKNFKTTYRLKYHVSRNHKEDPRISDLMEAKK